MSTELMHWKIYIDIMDIQFKDYETIFDIIEVGAAEPWFMGVRLLMCRYADEKTAQARAEELKPYCTVVEIEHVRA